MFTLANIVELRTMRTMGIIISKQGHLYCRKTVRTGFNRQNDHPDRIDSQNGSELAIRKVSVR